MENTQETTMTISLSQKVNLGNSQSADVFISMNGIKEGMTTDEMEPLLSTGKIAYDRLRVALAEEVSKARKQASA